MRAYLIDPFTSGNLENFIYLFLIAITWVSEVRDYCISALLIGIADIREATSLKGCTLLV